MNLSGTLTCPRCGSETPWPNECYCKNATETAWLIEQHINAVLHYFSPSMSKVGVGAAHWSKNHLEAVRFCRRMDAERTLLFLRLVSDQHDQSTVAEHMWVAP